MTVYGSFFPPRKLQGVPTAGSNAGGWETTHFPLVQKKAFFEITETMAQPKPPFKSCHSCLIRLYFHSSQGQTLVLWEVAGT